MSEDLADWVCAYLTRDDEIVVPVKKMWNVWRAGHARSTLAGFTALVLADSRIEEMGGVDHTEGIDNLNPDEWAEYEREMEALGYFSGPRVKLKAREITLEHIARMLKKHNDRMEEALRQAREALPDDAPEEHESALIQAIEQAKQLRRDLRRAGLDPDYQEAD